MKTLKTITFLWGLIVLLDILSFNLLFERAYKVSWLIFVSLLFFFAIIIIVVSIKMICTFFYIIFRKSTYKINRNLIPLIILILASPLLISTQVIASSMFTYTPDNGGVANIESININGSLQYYSVRTKNEQNPIILFLSGGPGGAQMPATREFLEDLESDYTIINWDQPGTGKSYDASYRYDVLTLDDYVSDAHALTNHLKEEYNQEKIYLIGESWGSYLAVILCQSFPEDYYAMIGTGQMVDFLETELYCYDHTLEIAKNTGNTVLIETLEEYGKPPYYGRSISLKINSYLNPIYIEMAINSEITHQNWDTFDVIISPEYSIWDSIGFLRGLLITFSRTYQTLYDDDLRETVTDLTVPIYIFHGLYDNNAPLYLAQEYYNLVQAPDKDFILFEHSGHNPWIDEYEKFCLEVKYHFDQHIN